ncbi:hypothetical protein BGW42_002383 [Actinomortierella wolfii]|nr:hypothetical protein BGW42_002383 [Actinomortierella wolfii]
MPDLPLDYIAKVVEWVDNRQDLFNLLTVSRDVFFIVARRLYRDPFKSRTEDFDMNIRTLVLFLISLSPASGDSIDLIRQTNPAGAPLDAQLMVNYLSLVTVIRWRGRHNNERLLRNMLWYRSLDLCMQLTWAFVGHRLDEVEELEIDVVDQERYLNNVAHMTRLRKVWIYRGRRVSYEATYDFAEALVRAIQSHHGPDQLRECQTTPDPFDGPCADSKDHETIISGALRVASLLPPPRNYLTLPGPDGSTISLDQPFDRFVATIKVVYSVDFELRNLLWKALMRVHPDQSYGQILQRFRGMTSLFIHPETANGSNEDLLAWAAREAECYYRQPNGQQLAPLVPLEKLQVMYEQSFGTIGPRRMVVPKWEILQDGLLGFAGTLSWLMVTYPQSEDGMVDHLFTTPRPLHKLKSLTLHELAIDRSVWEQIPNIEELHIWFCFPPLRGYVPTPIESQNDQDTGATPLSPIAVDTPTTITTTTTTVTTKQQLQRQLPEIWLHCPKLTRLTLRDRAINLLDPHCLHFLPNLQRLELLGKSMGSGERIADGGLDSCEEWAARRVLHPTRWTWDWSLPALRSLTLWGDFHEFRFSLAILRSCPALESMYLSHRNAVHRFPLRVKGVLDAPLDKNDNHMSPFTHSSLNSLKFHDSWDIERDELNCLLQLLPGLKEIELGSVHSDEGSDDRKLFEITKTYLH